MLIWNFISKYAHYILNKPILWECRAIFAICLFLWLLFLSVNCKLTSIETYHWKIQMDLVFAYVAPSQSTHSNWPHKIVFLFFCCLFAWLLFVIQSRNRIIYFGCNVLWYWKNRYDLVRLNMGLIFENFTSKCNIFINVLNKFAFTVEMDTKIR